MKAYSSHSELNERITSLIGTDMLELNAKVYEASINFERHKAAVEMLEHGRKALLARLHEAYREQLPNATEKRLENMARADDRYREYLVRMKHEKNKLADAQAEYFKLRNHQETLQLQLGFARSEMYLERN